MTNEEWFKLALDHVIRRQGLPPDDAPPEQVEAFADEVRKAMAAIAAAWDFVKDLPFTAEAKAEAARRAEKSERFLANVQDAIHWGRQPSAEPDEPEEASPAAPQP